jgi:hypothetical protein
MTSPAFAVIVESHIEYADRNSIFVIFAGSEVGGAAALA